MTTIPYRIATASWRISIHIILTTKSKHMQQQQRCKKESLLAISQLLILQTLISLIFADHNSHYLQYLIDNISVLLTITMFLFPIFH